MSMSNLFFFRLHNLRQEEARRKNRRGPFFDRANILNLAPSRLYEKAPLSPSDSLDELASHIPRCLFNRLMKANANIFPFLNTIFRGEGFFPSLTFKKSNFYFLIKYCDSKSTVGGCVFISTKKW